MALFEVGVRTETVVPAVVVDLVSNVGRFRLFFIGRRYRWRLGTGQKKITRSRVNLGSLEGSKNDGGFFQNMSFIHLLSGPLDESSPRTAKAIWGKLFRELAAQLHHLNERPPGLFA